MSSIKYFIALFLLIFVAASVSAQTTAFSYQGRLNDNSLPANGVYDLQFALYDAATAGTQIGTTQTLTGVSVAQGIFSVTLDFGGAAFPGADRYLELRVKKPAEATYTTLAPRQLITSAPYSVFANSPQGPQGPPGIPGPQGPQGIQGIQGAQGIVNVATVAGPIQGIAGSTTTFVFAGPQATVTTTATQSLVASGAAALGTLGGAGAGELFRIGWCYQSIAGGNITNGSFWITPKGATPDLYAVSSSVVPGAGTWRVGICVYNQSPTAFNNNDFVNGWVMVVNQ